MKSKIIEKDRYKIWNADVCMICDSTQVTSDGNGIRPVVCGKRAKRLKKRFKEWNKTGIYLTKKSK